METPLVNCTIKLEKFPGKGGCTYAPLPGVAPDKTNPFGSIKVKGTVDDYCVRQYHLIPMGNGNLFLPVKATVKKQEGDFVHILLYSDDEPPVVPSDFLDCLRDEPQLCLFSTDFRQ